MKTIIITNNWDADKKYKYPLHSEHKAKLYPCTDNPSETYAMLDDGSMIPNGCFVEKYEIPSIQQMVASMNA